MPIWSYNGLQKRSFSTINLFLELANKVNTRFIRVKNNMSYMKLGNTHIRENGHKVNVFKKVDEIKKDLKVVIPEIEGDKLLEIMGHCRSYYEGKFYYGRRTSPTRKKREMTQNERIVYDYLIRKGLKAPTIYRWFLATRLPDDVREKLAKGQVSYKAAMRITWNRKRAAETNQGLLLIEELRTIARTL